MATTDKDKTFNALAIRDTSNHNGAKIDTGEFTAQTIVTYNSLNQQVTLQLQGSLDGTTWLNIGSTWDVAASANNYQTVSDYFPCYRVTAICGTAPASGTLDVWILKTKAVI